jgi:hypothetical protein
LIELYKLKLQAMACVPRIIFKQEFSNQHFRLCPLAFYVAHIVASSSYHVHLPFIKLSGVIYDVERSGKEKIIIIWILHLGESQGSRQSEHDKNT